MPWLKKSRLMIQSIFNWYYYNNCPLMEQESKLEPIIHIQQDLTAAPHFRFYLQQQLYSPQNRRIELPFNQLSGQVVAQICLASKLLAQNTRTNTNLIENGKEIYSMKQQYFKAFLQNYKLIKQTIVYLHPQLRTIFEYTVLACSNLILKLSINMSKISIITVTKLLLPSYLNVFVISVIFQKFLECQLLKNSYSHKPEQRNRYVKQFPRITFIKIGVSQNPYDSYLINSSQDMFSPEASNVQFIDLFSSKSPKLSMKWQSAKNKRVEAFDLFELFGLRPPYGMELYFFFLEILMDKMTEFNPDIIIFTEEFPCDEVTIDPKIKGMIINEVSSRVQNKIFIFKEVGPCDLEDAKKFYQKSSYIKEIENLLVVERNIYQSRLFVTQENKMFEWYINQMSRLQLKMFSDISSYQAQYFRKKMESFFQKQVLAEDNSPFYKLTKTIKINLNEELSHLAVALIQKSNFEDVQKQFRTYMFPAEFLSLMIKWMQQQLQDLTNVTKGNTFSQTGQKYKHKIKKIKGMREMTLQRQLLTNIENEQYSVFYNLRSNRLECFQQEENGITKRIQIRAEDPYYIHYADTYILLLVVSSEHLTIYIRMQNQKVFSFIRRDFYSLNRNLQAKNSTLIANKEYLYKAFGQFKPPLSGKSVVCRLNITNVHQITKQSWQVLDQCLGKSDSNIPRSGHIKLPVKCWGWAESIQIGASNLIVFGGGYNSWVENQEKVSKHLYLIYGNSFQILRIGKTCNRLVNEAENIKLRNTIYPFVYGIPILTNNSELVVMNTNGCLENINDFKKLYLTKYRIPQKNEPVENFTAIGQNKMQLSNDIDESIADKNTLIAYIGRNYHRVNRFKGVVCFSDSEGNPVVFKLNSLQTGKDQIVAQNFGNYGIVLETISASFAKNKLIPRQPS